MTIIGIIAPQRGDASDSCRACGLLVVSAVEPDQRGRLRRRRLFCSRCHGWCLQPSWRCRRAELFSRRDKYQHCDDATTAAAAALIWKIKRFSSSYYIILLLR